MSEPLELTNLHHDPNCYKQRGTWMAPTPQQNGDKWRYDRHPSYKSMLFAWWGKSNNALMAGRVLYARVITGVQEVVDNLAIENATTIVRRDRWIAARVADDNTANHALPLQYGPLVLDEVAVYTPADWEHVYKLYEQGELTRPWFAGNLYLANSGGGVRLPSRYPHADLSLEVAA